MGTPEKLTKFLAECDAQNPMVFLGKRCEQCLLRLPLALRSSFLAALHTSQGKFRGRSVGYKAAGQSALTYFFIAVFWAYWDGAWDWHVLVSAPLMGALIAPCLAPWIRLFPVTGDPQFQRWRRFLDLLLNGCVHMLATSCFVFILKTFVSGFGLLLTGTWYQVAFIKGSIGLVLANYGRRYFTEYSGSHWAILKHPLGASLKLARPSCPRKREQELLSAWNDLRDLPGPGLLTLARKGWGYPPGGYRTLVDQSKLLDPALGSVIDHVLG